MGNYTNEFSIISNYKQFSYWSLAKMLQFFPGGGREWKEAAPLYNVDVVLTSSCLVKPLSPTIFTVSQVFPRLKQICFICMTIQFPRGEQVLAWFIAVAFVDRSAVVLSQAHICSYLWLDTGINRRQAWAKGLATTMAQIEIDSFEAPSSLQILVRIRF